MKLNKKWYSQKIKGDFAESICENHFLSLGYSVEKSGIESIAPIYCSNFSKIKNNKVKEYLNKTPDFIVSKNNEAFFVEVKYVDTISNDKEAFYKFGSSLIKKYNHILSNENVSIYFYVLVPHNDFYDSHVFLFMPEVYSPPKDFGWRSPKFKAIETLSGIDGFITSYSEIVEPFLNNIFKTKKKL
ncbi:MAG: hypothetical protein U9N59_12245 [Campylobacterota bacterium]|nr:hypothetical protein [Campylobacterota bacterium]